MKTKLTISILAVCLFLSGLAIKNNIFGSSGKIPELNIPMPGQETPMIDYGFNVDISSLPDTVMIYKFKKVNDTELKKRAEDMAKQLGLTNNVEFEPRNQSYVVKQDKYLLTFEKSTGYWAFRDMDSLNDIDTEKNIPEDSEAITIAKDFLNKYGIDSSRLGNVRVIEQYSGDVTTNDYKVNYKDIYFYPEIGNSQILGVSRVIVSIGNDGKVIAFNKYFKDYEPYKEMKLKHINIALDEVKKHKASVNINPEAIKANLNSVELAYWEDAGSINEQPYLQPVWVFRGEATLADNSTSAFDAIVPALEY